MVTVSNATNVIPRSSLAAFCALACIAPCPLAARSPPARLNQYVIHTPVSVCSHKNIVLPPNLVANASEPA